MSEDIELKAVAWRYRYAGDGRPVHWTLTQKPRVSKDAVPGWCAVVAEPLYAEADVRRALSPPLELGGEGETSVAESAGEEPDGSFASEGQRKSEGPEPPSHQVEQRGAKVPGVSVANPVRQ